VITPFFLESLEDKAKSKDDNLVIDIDPPLPLSTIFELLSTLYRMNGPTDFNVLQLINIFVTIISIDPKLSIAIGTSILI